MKSTDFISLPSSILGFPQASTPKRRRDGFSVIELIGVVTVLGILAAVAISKFTSTQSAVVATKLHSDVTKLNSLVMMYQASGGSLADAVTAQDVIDTLKTVRSSFDARMTVGPVTGREVDVRLTVRMQTETEAASNAARAIWNPGTMQFEIATSGPAGVASFTIDDSLAEYNYGAETRTPSNVLYNSEDGWVWKNDDAQGPPALAPLAALLSSVDGYNFDPTAPDGGSSQPVVAPLPPPAITPHGGAFYLANFVSSVSINAGLVPAGSSIPGYKVTHADGSSTEWAQYTAPIQITYGDTVSAKNMTIDAAHYSDSAVSSETYTVQPTLLPAPAITPSGGSYLASSWPAVSILPNGAPVGPYTAISYKITHSDGSTTPWTAYTGALVPMYGDTITAKNVTLNAQFYSDSGTVAQTYLVTGSSKLPPPLFSESTDSAGKRWVTIYPDTSTMPIPVGARIYYTTDGKDPGVNSTDDPLNTGRGGSDLYTAGKPVAVPTTGDFFEINARLYPPLADKIHFDTSDVGTYDISIAGPGLAGGHIDVDTAHLIYPPNKGTTDAHVHAYDDKYNVASVDLMNFLDTRLREIGKQIPTGVRFKLIVANGNLSPGGRLSINQAYNAANPATYSNVTSYQNTALNNLTVYSLDGVAGSTKLTSLTMNFQTESISNGGLIGTITGAVRGNKTGAQGEYRNGALTVQAVAVNANGTPAFTTNTALSNGGVHGVASTGLLWECTMFWHWHYGAY